MSSPISPPPPDTPETDPATSKSSRPLSFDSSHQIYHAQNGVPPATSSTTSANNSNLTKKSLQSKKAAAPSSTHYDDSNHGSSAADEPQKKPRKPRDPNSKAAIRRRQRLAEEAANGTTKNASNNGLMKISRLMDPVQPTAQAAGDRLSQYPVAQTGKNEVRSSTTRDVPGDDVSQHNSRPSSSGQHFDPIRSAASNHSYTPALTQRPSPSIASLINHQTSSTPSTQTQPNSNTVVPNIEKQVTAKANGDASQAERRQTALSNSTATPHASSHVHMDVDSNSSSVPNDQANKSDVTKNNSSPKPNRQKEAAPPATLGNGLLSNATFGRADAAPGEFAEVPNECLEIDIPITPGGDTYVNFMKEIERKYGFDVAHPRLAEHRKRMAEIAAAGAAIDPEPLSGDEMNLDVSDPDSNAEMAGTEDSEGPKRKRRKKANQYDKDDDFIDDSELLWQEQARASKDGYFVWSGPLVPESEKQSIEKGEGPTKRGRGGRGRGGATRGEGSTRGRGTGLGRGSRGGSTVRKPRVTKADRAKMESEKQERERMAPTAAKPSAYPGTLS